MRKSLLPVLLITVVIFSCKTVDNKVPQIAADFCNCFAGIQKNLSEDARKMFARAASAADPEKALQEEMTSLSEEDQEAMGTEMMALGELENENSEIGGCIKAVEKKYDNAYTLNQKKFAGKVIKELETKPGCDFTASLMKLGLKVEENK